ncbi:2123_t:CDS:2, partial [Dentiscutata heterogama]
ENEELRTTIGQLRGQREENIHYKEPKVSLPDKFDGTRALYRSFLNQVWLVIRMQPNRYPNDQAQVGLFESLLTEPALAWFASLLENESPILETFTNLIKEFKATFAAFIDQFRNGLRNDIKDLFLTVEDPTSLNDAITKAVRCDNRLFERKQE